MPTDNGQLRSLMKVQNLTDLAKLEVLAFDASMPTDVRRVSAVLAAAINDWSTNNLDSVKRFLAELKRNFGQLSKATIAGKPKNLSDP